MTDLEEDLLAVLELTTEKLWVAEFAYATKTSCSMKPEEHADLMVKALRDYIEKIKGENK